MYALHHWQENKHCVFATKTIIYELVSIFIINIMCSLDYNRLTRINNRHKCAFSVKVINVCYLH